MRWTEICNSTPWITRSYLEPNWAVSLRCSSNHSLDPLHVRSLLRGLKPEGVLTINTNELWRQKDNIYLCVAHLPFEEGLLQRARCWLALWGLPSKSPSLWVALGCCCATGPGGTLNWPRRFSVGWFPPWCRLLLLGCAGEELVTCDAGWSAEQHMAGPQGASRVICWVHYAKMFCFDMLASWLGWWWAANCNISVSSVRLVSLVCAKLWGHFDNVSGSAVLTPVLVGARCSGARCQCEHRWPQKSQSERY